MCYQNFHVFQLIFSNTQSIDDASVILDAEGDWTKRQIFFGFNILRIFVNDLKIEKNIIY